jgi:TonB family protein
MKSLSMLFCVVALFCGSSIAQDERPDSPLSRAAADLSLATTDTIPGGFDAPPPDFVEVEKEPTIISRKDPVYPELALRAGIEGKVWVKVWVDTKGRARTVSVLKSDNDVFNYSAVEAAKQFLFTPAYLHGKPVSVWVSIPFKFKMGAEAGEIAKNFQNLRSSLKHPTVLIISGPKQLENQINYPDLSITGRVEGAVYATVGLSEERTVSEIRITKSLDKYCDMAVMSGIANHDFAADKDLPDLKGGGSISVVVQFILPHK